jgi:electron transport complex protein RnfD
MTELLNVYAPPYIRSRDTFERAVWLVALALAPAFFYGIVWFGPRSLIMVMISVLACVGSEALVLSARRRPLTINDGSAFLTGLLLALSLPPGAPLWLPVIGGVFAILVVKQLFGGLGHNLFNPALAGRAFLMISWPGLMTTGWIVPSGSSLAGIDGITAATPLTILKNPSFYGNPAEILGRFNEWSALKNLFLGRIGGCIGEPSVLLLLIGGLFLLIIRITDYRIVIGYLASFAIAAFLLLNKINLGVCFFTGGLVLGAFFMAPDWVTSPVTKKGRWFFGVGCGLLTVILRRWSAYPEGVTFAILTMNMVTPLIDRLTRERVFGSRKESRR